MRVSHRATGATTMGDPKWNPRYLAYCKVHGLTPGDDRDEFYKFSLWIGQQKREAEEAKHPCVFRWSHIGLQIMSQTLWDEWLNREGATKLKE